MTAGLGINPAMGFSHSREMAKMVKAWNSAKVQAEVKTKVDAVAKAHGEPISMLKCDWVSLMTRFGDQHGDSIHETRPPAQSYFENFEEALADGSLEAERLDQVVNVVEERAELAKTPNAAKHLGIHLDASITIQVRRRFHSVLPATTEALRLKFSVMSNLWLLAKMRQPARQIFADFTETTLKILDELLSEKNFLLDRNIAGTRIVPKWDHCLECEYQVRRQAIKLCVRKGYSFRSAWWTVYRDVEHRMEHWVQLLTIANSNSDLAHTPSASTAVHNTEVAQFHREVDHLKQAVWSRSPRGGRGQGTQLTLSNRPFNESGNHRKKSFGGRKVKANKGRGKKGGKKGQEAASSGAARSSTGKTFDEILKDSTARAFVTANHQNGKVCWHFQRETCTRDCKRLHECARCGKLELGTTLAGVKHHVSELCVKKFSTLIRSMAASFLSRLFLWTSLSVPSIPTK